MANNHVDDAGVVGVKTTIAALRANNIIPIGLDTAAQPNLGVRRNEVLEVKGLKVGIFAFCSVGTCERQTQVEGWGPALLNSTSMAAISSTRRVVDILIVSIHWGSEYTTEIGNKRLTVAKSLARIGVDIVLGHHAHVPQNHTQFGSTFVAFGLSNFVFDSHVCRDPHTGDLTQESMTRSFGCRRMNPNDRLRMANLTRETRIYRFDVEAGVGVSAAEYLPCSIAKEPGHPPLYRPWPIDNRRWIAACIGVDKHCTPCK